MKPFSLFALLLALLLLPGCQNAEEARAKEIAAGLSPYYEADLRWDTGGGEVSASLSHPGPGGCAIALTGPENLAGMVYTLDGDGIRVEYRGLAFAIDPTGGGINSPLLLAEQALGVLLAPEPDTPPVQNGAGWKLTARAQNRDWTLLLDENGLPAKLFTSSPRLEITLENFRFLG